MNCQQCGNPLAEGLKFCPNCGAKVESMVAPAAFAAQAEAPQPIYQQPAYQPAPEPVYQPAPEPVYQPAPEPVYQPAPEPVYQPAPEPVYQPAPEPVYQPAPEPVYQPAPEPVYQPAPEPVYQPAPEPVYQSAPEQPQQFPQQPAFDPNQYQQFDPNQYQNAPAPAPAPAKPKKKKTGLIIGLIIGIIAIIGIAVAAIFILPTLNKPADVNVNLNDYLEVKFTGYDKFGEATITFDYDQLRTDYAEQLVWTGKKKNQPVDETPIDLLCDNVFVYLDNYWDLSNGDVVAVEWDVFFDSMVSLFPEIYANNAVVEYTDVTFTVSGLKQPETFDPFEGFQVTVTGKEGDTYIDYQLRDDLDVMSQIYWVDYEVNDGEGSVYSLSNGDVIHFSLDLDDWDYDYMTENYGMIPSTVDYYYTVEGLSAAHYIENTAEISSSFLQGLYDAVYDFQETGWVDYNEYDLYFNDCVYCGYIYCTSNGEYDVDTNVLYMILAITLDCVEPDGTAGTIEYYTYARITDLYYDNGTITFWEGDFDDYTDPYDSFEHEIQAGTLTIYGYSDAESIVNGINNMESDHFYLEYVEP